MSEEFVPRYKAPLPGGGPISAAKDRSTNITPLKERPELPFRPKPEPVPEPDGFTPEQLSARREAQEREDVLRFLKDEEIRLFEESLKG